MHLSITLNEESSQYLEEEEEEELRNSINYGWCNLHRKLYNKYNMKIACSIFYQSGHSKKDITHIIKTQENNHCIRRIRMTF